MAALSLGKLGRTGSRIERCVVTEAWHWAHMSLLSQASQANAVSLETVVVSAAGLEPLTAKGVSLCFHICKMLSTYLLDSGPGG